MCTPTLVTRPRDHDHPLIGGEFFDPPTDFQASNSRNGYYSRGSLPARGAPIPMRRVRNRVSRLIRALLGFWLYMHPPR